ncbi:hypothetical protein QVD17_03016 [Tagetes erecta]|uniref:Uncharacterized protein n=1 Tax=Tagetes erecta TaxID=13708 RepID=A0AAD8L996_TARER|nr:hypothetical protein QVD17_03016 [Tagetes erecta]
MAAVKRISSFIADQVTVIAVRRGFASAATTQGNVSGSVRGSGVAMMKKGSEESKKSTPWIPDPVTGYYRPEGQIKEVDAAELRELLLKHKNRRN